MTAGEFDELRPQLGRLSADTVEAARQVLVEGRAQIDVARERGLSKQRLSGMVGRVLTAARQVLKGWQHVEAWLPPDLADQVRRMEAATRSAADGKEDHA